MKADLNNTSPFPVHLDEITGSFIIILR